MKNSEGRFETVPLIPPHKGQRTLGVYIYPQGNMKAQYDHLRSKLIKWAQKIKSCHLPAELVWQAFITCLLKTLEFPLTVTTLTHAQCRQILSPALTVALQKSHIIGKLKRDVAYGPMLSQGLGVPCFIQPRALVTLDACSQLLLNARQLSPSSSWRRVKLPKLKPAFPSPFGNTSSWSLATLLQIHRFHIHGNSVTLSPPLSIH